MDIQTSLNYMADALKMHIHYEGGQVSGTTSMLYCPLPGLEIPITVTLKKIFVAETVGVLAHVLGDLHVAIVHAPSTRGVTLFMIDGASKNEVYLGGKLESVIKKNYGISSMVKAIRLVIVEAFLWKDHNWSVLKLPK